MSELHTTTALDAERLDSDRAVRERYTAAARERAPDLCCPVEYDGRFLDALPPEIVQRDYGCGDPSKHLRAGERVLDLGSGGGKICYIAAQVVGPQGSVIGVDANDEMLALARKHLREVGERIGYHNVEFREGRIQDLALDLERFEEYLRENPIRTSSDWLLAQEHAERLRRESPLIPGDSIDVVVSNCVLNLVREEDRRQLFAEVFRVLRPGGRAVISDITCDEPVPERLKRDAALWSGCISGAFVEQELPRAFADAGFYGMRILARQEEPWARVEGIEFRSLTVEAYKGTEGPSKDRNQAVIYKGPWKSVTDDDGRVLRRGERMAVCDKTYHIYTSGPYAADVIPVPPREAVAPGDAPDYNFRRNAVRHPRETKGLDYHATELSEGECCGPDGCC